MILDKCIVMEPLGEKHGERPVSWYRWRPTTKPGIWNRFVASIRQFAPECSVLVIDDNSPDGTGKIADEPAKLPAVHVIHRAGKLGLGTAMLGGHFLCRGQPVRLPAESRRRLQLSPQVHPGVAGWDAGPRRDDRLAMCPAAESRGDSISSWKLMSTGINWYARLLLGLSSKDNSGAFRCYRVSKLALIDLEKVRSRGYSFQEEILYWCKRVLQIVETPILFGESSIRRVEDQHERGDLRTLDPPATRRDTRPLSTRRATVASTARPRASIGDVPSRVATRSDEFAFADRHVDFLAGLGDLLAQPLVLRLELVRVHPQDLAQEGTVTTISFLCQLIQ